MAIYKVYPEKDASIYSEFPSRNAGIDEILEINANQNFVGDNVVARSLIKFSQSDITSTISKISGSFDVYLRLYLANAEELPTEYTIYTHPVSRSWEMGTGRYSNIPETIQGVSWVSCSLDTTWFATGSSYYHNIAASQSFVYNDVKDLEIKVTNIVNLWTSSLPNEGLLLKHSESLEYNPDNNIILKYFSKDTHTIYPPCLEFRWNDISYTTGSGTLISNTNIVVALQNNKATYNQSSIQKFKLFTRDKYPVRTFQTSSVYLNGKLLPSSSYWGLRDLNTKEMVVDFDTAYTRIGSDGTNNYFNVYMNGLESERYYEVLIKTEINGETIIIDDDNYFKVIR